MLRREREKNFSKEYSSKIFFPKIAFLETFEIKKIDLI